MNPLYESFICIVESGSLVRAGEILHVTQPTITRHVQQLEHQLGVPLFDRVGKRMVMNQAGEIVYRYAKSHQVLQIRMLDEISVLSNPEQGTVFLGAGLTPSIYMLPSLLSQYRHTHPAVQFQIRSGSSDETYQALLQREIDIGIVTTLANDEQVEAVPLFRDDLMLVAPPLHELATYSLVTFSQVLDYPFILMKEGSGLRRMIADLTESRGLVAQVGMETDSLESINRLVQCGAGISVLPRTSVQDDIAAGRLVELRLADVPLGERTITLITRREGMLSACARQFATFVMDAFTKNDVQ